MAVAIQLLPAFDDVPPTNSDRAFIVATAERPSAPSRDLPNQPHGVSLVQLRQTHAGRRTSASSSASLPDDPDQIGSADESRDRTGGDLGGCEQHATKRITGRQQYSAEQERARHQRGDRRRRGVPEADAERRGRRSRSDPSTQPWPRPGSNRRCTRGTTLASRARPALRPRPLPRREGSIDAPDG